MDQFHVMYFLGAVVDGEYVSIYRWMSKSVTTVDNN